MAKENRKPEPEKAAIERPAETKPVAARQAMTAKEAEALGLDPAVYGG